MAGLGEQSERGIMAGEPNRLAREVATLAGGCFWCLEAVFEQLRGVASVVSGYMGGAINRPTYEQVCTGRTGHAEVVQITFDPAAISFDDLLDVFFTIHDPTTLNRQGADTGTQYRSAVFWHSEMQRDAAIRKISELDQAGLWSSPVVTQVVAAEEFFPAESYHQGYFRLHERQPYCQMVISPKVAKLRSKFRQKLKA